MTAPIVLFAVLDFGEVAALACTPVPIGFGFLIGRRARSQPTIIRDSGILGGAGALPLVILLISRVDPSDTMAPLFYFLSVGYPAIVGFALFALTALTATLVRNLTRRNGAAQAMQPRTDGDSTAAR
ncbi:MAG: hypothetical protein U1D55_03035 [Phycisphaerae bacterium]